MGKTVLLESNAYEQDHGCDGGAGMTEFLIGLLIGGCVGVLCMALLNVSAAAEDKAKLTK